jgi:biopolymer transport protein ExbD
MPTALRRYRGAAANAEMNVIPLVDVLLVLLVIFMVTAPLLTHAVKIELPKASSQVNIQKPEHIEFGIRENGDLFWNGEKLSFAELCPPASQLPPRAHRSRNYIFGRIGSRLTRMWPRACRPRRRRDWCGSDSRPILCRHYSGQRLMTTGDAPSVSRARAAAPRASASLA